MMTLALSLTFLMNAPVQSLPPVAAPRMPIIVLSKAEIPSEQPSTITTTEAEKFLSDNFIRYTKHETEHFDVLVSERIAPISDLKLSIDWMSKLEKLQGGILDISSPEGPLLFDSLSKTMRTDGFDIGAGSPQLGISPAIQIKGLPTIDEKFIVIPLVSDQQSQINPVVNTPPDPSSSQKYFEQAKAKPSVFPNLREVGHFEVIDFGYSRKLSSDSSVTLKEVSEVLHKLGVELEQLKQQFELALDNLLRAIAGQFYNGEFMLKGETPFSKLPESVRVQLMSNARMQPGLLGFNNSADAIAFLESDPKLTIDTHLATVLRIKNSNYPDQNASMTTIVKIRP